VTFACDGYISLAGTLTIAANTAIDGSDRAITISGSSAVRVFTVKSGFSLSLNELPVS
jgi:hypothetical protein